MNCDDLTRMEQYANDLRQNAFKDCAARISQVINYHLAMNPGVGTMQMNEQQLKNLIADIILVTDQIRMYGERLPDVED